MSLCQVIGLQRGVRYRAKSTDGSWRVLSEGSTLATGEAIEVKAGSVQFGRTVCTLQNRVSGAWVDAIAITLDLAAGTSHTRTDQLTITGDATDSTVAIALTYAKGHAAAKRSHDAQVMMESKRGIVFEWADQQWDGVLSEVERGRDHDRGGFMEQVDARIVANRRQFAVAGVMPIAGNKLITEGEGFEIVDPIGVGDAALTFELRGANHA